MATEVSDVLRTYVASLQRDYPSWNAYADGLGSAAEPESQRWVRLSVETIAHADFENRYEDAGLLDVTFNARFNWRANSARTDILGATDMVATFLAWLLVTDRVRRRTTSTLTPSTTPYYETDDPSRREVVVQWTVQIAVTTAYDAEGPVLPVEPSVGTPLTRTDIDFNLEGAT